MRKIFVELRHASENHLTNVKNSKGLRSAKQLLCNDRRQEKKVALDFHKGG